EPSDPCRQHRTARDFHSVAAAAVMRAGAALRPVRVNQDRAADDRTDRAEEQRGRRAVVAAAASPTSPSAPAELRERRLVERRCGRREVEYPQRALPRTECNGQRFAVERERCAYLLFRLLFVGGKERCGLTEQADDQRCGRRAADGDHGSTPNTGLALR